ncbi:hypothetical protein [Dictyobacter formicarum]|uniref:DUF2267 domain-containing protein n=1 Tax=Dictyobacter formicarum TaxID=2778368 RepID=A0ABQ3VQP1_9CHLR|nr:hypothetical protein [Dictyobacter formicarum]GHO88014.1 hypothetical protein KSZ_60200 [Dictyobacter formicarum]
MKTNPGQSADQSAVDPIVEALIKELIGSTSYQKSSSRSEDKITAALVDAYMALLKPSEQAKTPTASLETVILAEALAPVLAEALAPILAEELAPALVKALSQMPDILQGKQEAAPKKGSGKQDVD